MKPFILAITRPVSSGKTTIAAQLAKETSHCVNIDADHVKHFIVNGYINEPAWENIQKYVTLDCKVMPLPQLDAPKQRGTDRQDGYQMGVEAATRHYNYFSTSIYYDDFTKIDSAPHSTKETV